MQQNDEADDLDRTTQQIHQHIIPLRPSPLHPLPENAAEDKVQELGNKEGEKNINQRSEVLPDWNLENCLLQNLYPVETEIQPANLPHFRDYQFGSAPAQDRAARRIAQRQFDCSDLVAPLALQERHSDRFFRLPCPEGERTCLGGVIDVRSRSIIGGDKLDGYGTVRLAGAPERYVRGVRMRFGSEARVGELDGRSPRLTLSVGRNGGEREGGD